MSNCGQPTTVKVKQPLNYSFSARGNAANPGSVLNGKPDLNNKSIQAGIGSFGRIEAMTTHTFTDFHDPSSPYKIAPAQSAGIVDGNNLVNSTTPQGAVFTDQMGATGQQVNDAGANLTLNPESCPVFK
ncbi:hypothetical protein HK098_005474 [Nowakowskiella sp. JEL0407]|nr:hypothetical protein HK098_005474 [Nowakowskiella sp. JEL0407]